MDRRKLLTVGVPALAVGGGATAAIYEGRKPEVPNDQFHPQWTPLAVGTSGPHVQIVQHLLGLATDGFYGPDTEDAVRAFQEDPNHVDAAGNRLDPDGMVGQHTWWSLHNS